MFLRWLKTPNDLTPVQMNFFTESLTRYVFEHFDLLGKVAIDVGANQGFHTRTLMSSVGERGHLHVFEPNPIYENELLAILRPSDFFHRNALSDADGIVDFFIASNGNLSTLLPPKDMSSFNLSSAVTKTGDSSICTFDVVGAIKIDVEGAEHLVLRGMERIILRDLPLIVCERSENFSAEVYLISMGYTLFNLFGQRLNDHDCILANYVAVPPGIIFNESWLSTIDMYEYFDWYSKIFTNH
jgi:FkbM family methyltransferase